MPVMDFLRSGLAWVVLLFSGWFGMGQMPPSVSQNQPEAAPTLQLAATSSASPVLISNNPLGALFTAPPGFSLPSQSLAESASSTAEYFKKKFAPGRSRASGGRSGPSAESIAPTISFSPLTKQYGDANFSLTPSSDSSGTFSFESSNTAVATVSGSTVTLHAVGTTTITATQAASGAYLASTASALLTVDRGTPTLRGFSDVLKQLGDTTFSLTAPTSDSAGSITYESSNHAVATVSGTTVTLGSETGTTVITATQAPNGNYATGTASFTLTLANGYCENNPEVCNVGTCTNLPNNEFSCSCPAQATGALCDQCSVTYNTCRNGSACSPRLTGVVCLCTEFFCGTSCASPADPDICPGGQLQTGAPPLSEAIRDGVRKLAVVVTQLFSFYF